MKDVDDRPEAQALFSALKAALPQLEELLTKATAEWTYEDGFYRYYHYSFKAYYLQGQTTAIVEALKALMPGRELNKQFSEIVARGTGKAFKMEHNKRWDEEVRPILEAFAHARFFLEMAVRYGKELEAPPNMLPNGWAAFLYLYDLR